MADVPEVKGVGQEDWEGEVGNQWQDLKVEVLEQGHCDEDLEEQEEAGKESKVEGSVEDALEWED